MPVHVSPAEIDRRMTATRAALAEAGLDGLVMFKPESHYWLTGYDTFGYCFFQALVLRADGDLVLLTRSADLRQAQLTSTIEDIRIWVDRDGADPARELAALLGEKGLAGKRIGVELDTHGLTYANGKRLEAALDGVVTMVDASRLVSRLRLVKSAEELAFVRRAGELGDAALEAAIAHTWRACTMRSSRPVATIPATRSSSAAARRRCSAAIRAAAAGSTRRTS
jgi:Xaa-Pro dipeptidase